MLLFFVSNKDGSAGKFLGRKEAKNLGETLPSLNLS
jgi:hypothetical protein